MIRNCDNCENQNPKNMIQICNSDGYPLYAECKNWKAKISKECKKCDNYEVCENGCFGSTEPCEYLQKDGYEQNKEPKPNYWGEY